MATDAPPDSHANLTRDEARERAALLSDVAYDVSLDLTGDGPTFPSRTTVRFAARPGAVTFIDLTAVSIRGAWLNGRALPPTAWTGTRLLLDELAEHNELVVDADFRYQRTGVGLHRFTDPVDGAVYLHTQFEPFDANRVYACFDQPDLKAPFTLTVTAPAGWKVVSNAPPRAQPTAGEAGTWRFAPTPPLSTYLTAVVAGPFHEVRAAHGDIDLGLYCRGSLADHLDPEEIFAVTRQGLTFFERVFDAPYPFGAAEAGGPRRYDQLFVPEFNHGAMENPGCVTFTEQYVFRSRVTDAARQSRASTILHEMAHMWFGDLVTMRWWDDLWLNESFATYMGTLALAEATRFSDAWTEFATDIKAWAYRQDQLPTTHPVVADMVDTDAVRVNFDGITYAKGASVLKQLAAWVGRDAFLAGLRDYFARHAWSNAELSDFLGALETASGRDLGRWAGQWLQTTGVNTLSVSTEVVEGDYRAVHVHQAPPQPATESDESGLRDHRLAVGLYDLDEDGALRRREQVALDVRGAATEIGALAGQKAAALVLLNDDDLTYAKTRPDPGTLQTMERRLSALADPLARALCWGTAWDLTRDAALPASRFVPLVIAHAPAEPEIGLLQSVLGEAVSAADRFAAPANRSRLRTDLAARARSAAAQAPPGSDAQLAWVRCVAAAADSAEDRAWLGALLSGEAALPGLTVDTDLRWELLTALAAAGVADEAQIDAEESRDPTDIGRRRAATARAARPDAEAKQAAWDALLEDTTLPLAMQRALVAGLHRPGQEELSRRFIDAYPQALRRIWSVRGPDEALLLTRGLYPATVVADEVLAAADRALAAELPAEAHRLVAEARDGTQRALRARAADAHAHQATASP